MSSTPGPSFNPDDIRRCREQHRDLFSTAQVRIPWVFISGDAPLQCLAPPQLEDAIRRFNALAGPEGSVITDDLRDYLNSQFETVNRRFETMQSQLDRRFDAVEGRLDTVD